MNADRIQHITIGIVQMLIGLCALLELVGLLPEHANVNAVLLALLASVSGGHHAVEGLNGHATKPGDP